MTASQSDGYDSRPGRVVWERDLAEIDSLSEEIVLAIVEHTDREITDLEHLNASLDPDALDDLFPTGADDRPCTAARLCFRYDEFWIGIDAGGPVRIRHLD